MQVERQVEGRLNAGLIPFNARLERQVECRFRQVENAGLETIRCGFYLYSIECHSVNIFHRLMPPVFTGGFDFHDKFRALA